MHKGLHRFIISVLAVLLPGCAPRVRLPEWSFSQADVPKISWSPASANLRNPSLKLVSNEGGTTLAHIESVFTADTVEAMGRPTGERLFVFSSPSGNTLVAHENASESSPDEQIAIFSRSERTGRWSVIAVFPPHQDGPVYGNYGVTRGVDDEYLYYHFPDGVLRRARLASLVLRPVRHQNQGE